MTPRDMSSAAAKRHKPKQQEIISADSALWPNLGFVRVGALDYHVRQYDAEWLRHVAERVQQSGQSLGPQQWMVETCLRDLASSTAAIKELNKYTTRAPQPLRGLNIAVHYLANKEIVGKRLAKNALADVATAWSMKPSAVKDLNGLFAQKASEELEVLVKLCTSRPHQSWDRRDVLAAIDADMRHRAQRLDWLAIRRKSGKRKSKRSAKRKRILPT